MKNYTKNISSFKNGETSSYLNAFYDDNKVGAKKIQNLVITPFATLLRRAGSEYLSTLEYNDSNKLVSFVEGDNSFLIEVFNNLEGVFFRFYQNKKAIIKENQHYKILASCYKKHQILDISFILDKGNKRYILLHKEVHPMILKWDEDYNFTLEEFDFFDGVYDKINDTNITISLSAIEGDNIRIYANNDLFNEKDVNKYLRASHNTLWGIAKITSFINPKEVIAKVYQNFNSKNATKDFRLSLWDESFGYPQNGVIFNNRFYCFHKNYFWGSKLLDFKDFSPTSRVVEENVTMDIITYDNAISVMLKEVENITWLKATKNQLFLGTTDGNFHFKPFIVDEAISPYNYTIEKLNSFTSNTTAISNDDSIFYSDINQDNITGIFVSGEENIVLSQINQSSKHLTLSGIEDITIIKYPFEIIVSLTKDGTLACGTIFTNSNFVEVAWFELILAGENAKVQSLATSYLKGKSYLFLSVIRNINNELRQFLEVIEFHDMKYLSSNDIVEPIYLDCFTKAFVIDEQIENINHLQNSKVALYNQEKKQYLNEYQVIDSSIIAKNLEDQEVILGYNFSSIYQQNNLNDTSYFSNEKKIEDISLYVDNSKNLEIYYPKEGDIFNEIANPSFIDEEGSKKIYNIKLDFPWKMSPEFIIEQKTPFGMHLYFIKLNIKIK